MINNFSTAKINLTRVMIGLCLSLLFITLTSMIRTDYAELSAKQFPQLDNMNITPGDTIFPAPDLTTWAKEIGRKSPEGLAGESVISFWVESDGTVKDYQISKSAGEVLDKWAIDFIKIIGYWRPASINGNPVRYKVNIPFEFTSDGNAKVKLLKGGAIFSGDVSNSDQKPEEDRGPLYPGGDEARINYISKNIVYPEDARKAGTEGTVYVQFVITEKGKVTQVKVIKGVSTSIDKVALEVVSKMPDWKPAIKNGKPVAYEMTMPIAFKLDNKSRAKESVQDKAYPEDTYSKTNTTPVTKEGRVYTVVEETPEFPGGDDARIAFVNSNIVYPPEARKQGIQGTVYITFVVEPDGSITEAKVLRGVGGGLDEAALEVVKKMPKWKPAKVKGEPVPVQFNMPIKFKLQNDEKTKIDEKTK